MSVTKKMCTFFLKVKIRKTFSKGGKFGKVFWQVTRFHSFLNNFGNKIKIAEICYVTKEIYECF